MYLLPPKSLRISLDQPTRTDLRRAAAQKLVEIRRIGSYRIACRALSLQQRLERRIEVATRGKVVE